MNYLKTDWIYRQCIKSSENEVTYKISDYLIYKTIIKEMRSYFVIQRGFLFPIPDISDYTIYVSRETVDNINLVDEEE